MASISRFLLDLFFPPHCVYCNRILDSSLEPVCHRCPPTLPWIADETPLPKGMYYRSCACAAWYQGPVRDAMIQYKFHHQPDHAKAFAKPLAQCIQHHYPSSFDLLSWIPVSQERLSERGYDQAYLLAQEVAQLLAIPLTSTLEKRHKPAQSSLNSPAERLENMKGAFLVPASEVINGKRILLIDDIITTGATLDAAASSLLQRGASEILCACFARTPQSSQA